MAITPMQIGDTDNETGATGSPYVHTITQFERPSIEQEQLIEQLERERNLLRSILDNSGNYHLACFDREFNFIHVNKLYALGCGHSPDELIGKNHFAFFPDEENEKIFHRVRDTGIAEEYHDKPFIYPNQPERGTTYWDWALTPQMDKYGNVVSLVLALSETTRRRKVENELIERFALLADTAGNLLHTSEPQKIIDSLCRKAIKLLKCELFFNYLADSEHERLTLNAYAGISENEAKSISTLDFGVAVCGRVARDGFRIVKEHIQEVSDQCTDLVRSYNVKAYACYPLLAENGKVLGTLSFGSKNRDTFSNDELLFVNAIADQVAVAIDRVERERKSEISAARYEAILNSLSEGLIITNPDGTFVEMNTAALRLHGFLSPDQVWRNLVEYQTTFELRDIQGTLIPIDLWPVKKVQRGEKVQDYNAWMKRKDTGTSVLVTYTGVRVYDRNKECINMVFTMRDVTVQKHLEEQLHREHELLQTIYDSIPVMLTIYDPSKLTFQVNKFLEQVTGWINEEMGQSDAMEKVYPDPAYRALVSEYVKSLQPGFKDLIMTGKCGEKIESSWANIQLADGRQVGIGLDIRERKRSEEELRLAYSRLRTLFDHRISGIGILFARADGEITEANDFFLQMLGYTREEFQSGLVNWKTLTPPEWDTTDKTALTQLQERGVSETLEKEYLHCNGKRVPVLVVGALMPGTANDILAFVMDITERKIAEKELVERANKLAEANRNLESFSYSVSHDLRNPLHTIKGICEFFHDEYGHIDERCREYLRLIDVAVDKANTLISNILRLSRISQQEIVVQQVDLSEIALMLIKELRQKEPHREVEVSIGDNLIVTGDRMLLTIALSNLLENAWKYTGKTKQPLIEFDSISHCAINDHQSSAFKQFFVRDNGVGFAMKYAYKLFKAFQRLHTERDFPGTGVGLTIVEQVIKKHGGRVWAESEIGKGSTFYFTIPDQWRP